MLAHVILLSSFALLKKTLEKHNVKANQRRPPYFDWKKEQLPPSGWAVCWNNIKPLCRTYSKTFALPWIVVYCSIVFLSCKSSV